MDQNKYKNVIFEGSTFPDDPYRHLAVKLGTTVKNEYLPAIEKLSLPTGLKLLMVAMTNMEGFRPGSRSHRTNNPGNIGNTDSGKNKPFPTLQAGIEAQAKHLTEIAEGKKKAYPLNQWVTLKPYYSPEIAKNPQYGLPANLPGYRFIYTGQLDQFIKIYSTGARATNVYINQIVSYFADNGLEITPDDRLSDIISLN